jgi:hypothetical protein
LPDFLSEIGKRDKKVAPKCNAFRSARQGRSPTATEKSKLRGCSFDLKSE